MSEVRPIISDDPLYQLLREGKVKEFNEHRENGEAAAFSGYDFRGLDLKGLNAKGLDLSNCYFRQADLRGIDFSEANLDGASINGSKISGTLFPRQLSAEEITLSLMHGSRMRYSSS
jgi:uncharacterized protein YjbI with pentapeptide repeats